MLSVLSGGTSIAVSRLITEGFGIAALAYRALVVDLRAYVCWDAAMRRGNQILAAAASFLTPVLSTAAIAVVLGTPPGWLFWAACALSVCGAAVCRLSILESRARAGGSLG